MDEKKYSLYRHVNKSNGKMYIGITSQKPQRRWANGLGYQTQPFYRAIQKYGWDNFNHIIVKTGMTKEEAEKMEIEEIRENHSLITENGYNIDMGGKLRSPSKFTPIYCFNCYGEYLKKYDSISQACEELNLAGPNIISVCKGIVNYIGGYVFKYVKDIRDPNKFKDTFDPFSLDMIFPIYQFDLQQNIIAEYTDALTASYVTGFQEDGILSTCRGENKKCGNYIWRFKRDVPDLYEFKNNKIDLERHYPHGQEVIQFDLDGNYIKEYESAVQAAEVFNCSSCLISYACIGRALSAKGYQWRYKKDYYGGNIGRSDTKKRTGILYSSI